MTIRYSSDQQVFPVAEVDTEKAGFVDVRSPGATPPCVAEVRVDEIGLVELVMLGPRSGADSGNLKPNLEMVVDQYSVGRMLLVGHGRIDQVLDIRPAVGDLLERLRTLHQVCRYSDQARIESSNKSESNLHSISRQRRDIPPPVLDVLLDGLAAKSDLQKSVFERFGGQSRAHTERLPLCDFSREVLR